MIGKEETSSGVDVISHYTLYADVPNTDEQEEDNRKQIFAISFLFNDTSRGSSSTTSFPSYVMMLGSKLQSIICRKY